MSIRRIEDIKLGKLKMELNERFVGGVLTFIFKESPLRTRKVLNNIYRLFSNIDTNMQSYKEHPKLTAMIMTVVLAMEAKLDLDFNNDDIIKNRCISEGTPINPFVEDVVNEIGMYEITYEESIYLVRQIEDRLKYGYILALKETNDDIHAKLMNGDIVTYKQLADRLYNLAAEIINTKRQISSMDNNQSFSLLDNDFESSVEVSLDKLKDKNKMLRTGIQRWNTLLGGAYFSKRLYTYLAFPGGGKSQILLKSALDIKKYNKIETKDPNKIPTVLYITMENDIDETIERLYNMTVTSEDIRNAETKDVIRELRETGQLKITEESNVNIIVKYYPNQSISTDDLYTIIDDTNDSGSEVIALVLDYMKRIRPSAKALNEKEELKHITNELKTLAKEKEIPVITAQQLNRSAASIVDSAMQSNKTDVTKLVGRDGVAGAWEIIENSDVVIVLNQEVQQTTGRLYMTFKLLKRRYKPFISDYRLRTLEYFNHPYKDESTIMLEDDINSNIVKSCYGLSNGGIHNMEDIDDPKGLRGTIFAYEEVEKDVKITDNLIDNIENGSIEITDVKDGEDIVLDKDTMEHTNNDTPSVMMNPTFDIYPDNKINNEPIPSERPSLYGLEPGTNPLQQRVPVQLHFSNKPGQLFSIHQRPFSDPRIMAMNSDNNTTNDKPVVSSNNNWY